MLWDAEPVTELSDSWFLLCKMGILTVPTLKGYREHLARTQQIADVIGNNNLVFLFSKGPSGPQHRDGLVTDKCPCASPALGAVQEEVGVGGLYCP